MGKIKKTILIDLDGVLNNYNGNFEEDKIPDLKFGAFEFLQKLSLEYKIKIFTTRNKLLTAKWLIDNNLYDYIEDVTNLKEPAYLYIDDRCICFNNNYHDMYYQIKNFKTYWSRTAGSDKII